MAFGNWLKRFHGTFHTKIIPFFNFYTQRKQCDAENTYIKCSASNRYDLKLNSRANAYEHNLMTFTIITSIKKCQRKIHTQTQAIVFSVCVRVCLCVNRQVKIHTTEYLVSVCQTYFRKNAFHSYFVEMNTYAKYWPIWFQHLYGFLKNLENGSPNTFIAIKRGKVETRNCWMINLKIVFIVLGKFG